LQLTESGLRRRLRCLQSEGNPFDRIVPLAGDASTRAYFRAFYPDRKSAIIMLQPNAGRNEEADFLSVHNFLEGLNLPVPRVYFHDIKQSLVVLEDLGDQLLEHVFQRSERDRIKEMYEEAVDLLLRMRRATAAHDSGCPAFRLAFDEEKLMQEMDFFMTHFVRGLCKQEPTGPALRSLGEFFRRICRLLASEPRIFTHRDYHSRNLIVHRGRLVMIDFQDARMGPAQYDLASLLRDSYVSLPEDLVDELVRSYAAAVGETGAASLERFRYVFDVMSLQRNIKALGTFGYQFTVRGSSRYLSAIPRTGSYVARNIALYPEFGPFRSAVEEFVYTPSLELANIIRS